MIRFAANFRIKRKRDASAFRFLISIHEKVAMNVTLLLFALISLLIAIDESAGARPSEDTK